MKVRGDLLLMVCAHLQCTAFKTGLGTVGYCKGRRTLKKFTSLTTHFDSWIIMMYINRHDMRNTDDAANIILQSVFNKQAPTLNHQVFVILLMKPLWWEQQARLIIDKLSRRLSL